MIAKLKRLSLACLALSSLSSPAAFAHSSLTVMSDQQLSETTGQALMSLGYTSPSDFNNIESQRKGGDKTIGFYKLGLEAEVELNANIHKLQVGCGGVNGSGCDIDIDYLSLSGISESSEGRAGSSAILSNPFFEFAMKNPESSALREFAGLRISAEAIQGLLTFGLENGPNKSGINSLSGYMEVAAAGGEVTVNPLNNVTYANTERTSITGKITDNITSINFTSTNYDLNINPKQKGRLVLPQQVITGHRINNAFLKAQADVSGLELSGKLSAAIRVGIIPATLNKNLTGTIKNLKVDVTIDEGLGFFHKANLNGSAASLSLQAKNIQWPGAKSIANQGWWLELSNPIDIGDVTPSDNVSIDLPTLKEALAQVSGEITRNPIKCGTGGYLGCLFGDIDAKTINLGNAKPVSMELKNLQLLNQNFAPNCYGGLKFC